jgi:hypothetical protein
MLNYLSTGTPLPPFTQFYIINKVIVTSAELRFSLSTASLYVNTLHRMLHEMTDKFQDIINWVIWCEEYYHHSVLTIKALMLKTAETKKIA